MANKANHLLAYIHYDKCGSRSREVIILLYLAHRILRLILSCHTQKRLEEIGGGPANSCTDGQGLEYIPYEKLKEPGLLHLIERRFREDQIAGYDWLEESEITEITTAVVVDGIERIRDHK